MTSKDDILLAGFLASAVIVIICLLILCYALYKFIKKMEIPSDIEKDIIFDHEYDNDTAVEETAVWNKDFCKSPIVE